MHALSYVLLTATLCLLSQQAEAMTKCWSCGGKEPPCKKTLQDPVNNCANEWTKDCEEKFGKVTECNGICIINVHVNRDVVHDITRGCTDQVTGSKATNKNGDENKELRCDYNYCNAEVSGTSINKDRPKNAANGKPIGLFLIFVSAAMVLSGAL